jgi:hypothetical protein
VDRSVSSELVGQLLRAEADVLLATRGHEIRQDVMHRIAEVEADDVEPSRPIYADDDKTEVGRDYSVEADDEMPVPSTTEIAHARREARMFNNHEPWRVLCNRYTEWHESGFSADAWADDSLTYGGA